MKVYIAGKYEERELIKKYADQLRAEGHTITKAWFERPDMDLSEEAIEDVIGVVSADVCIFVFEHDLPYSGALTEFGMALVGYRDHFPLVIVVGHACDRNIFMHIPCVKKVETFKDALAAIRS